MPKISVIIPTHNRLETLPRAVHSVLEQSFGDFELLVVDDGSNDGTRGWLKELQDELSSSSHPEKNLRVFEQEQQGVSSARNLGIREAKSQWLAFLDSDDEWLPEKLAKQIAWVDQHPDDLIVHTDEIWIRHGRRVNPHKKHQKHGGRIFTRCLPLCLMSPSTIMIHRDVFEDVGTFKTDYEVCEDYDLWLRITAKYCVGFVDEPLIKKYGGHSDQLSRKHFAMDYWRVRSLAAIADSPDISDEERRLVWQEVEKKSRVLLKGYLKHDNKKNYDEVEKLSQRAQAFSMAQSERIL